MGIIGIPLYTESRRARPKASDITESRPIWTELTERPAHRCIVSGRWRDLEEDTDGFRKRDGIVVDARGGGGLGLDRRDLLGHLRHRRRISTPPAGATLRGAPHTLVGPDRLRAGIR